MSLTKVTFSMVNSAPVDLADFGVVYGSTTNATPMILAALQTGKPVYVGGTCRVSTQLDASSLTNAVLFSDGIGVIEIDSAAIADDWFRVNSTNTVEKIQFTNVKFKGLSTTESAPATQIFNVDGVTIENCYFDTAYLQVKNSSNVKVINNTCKNWRANGSGMFLSGIDIVCTENLLIVDENVDSDDGIAVTSESRRVVISNNIIDKSAVTTGYTRIGININSTVGGAAINAIMQDISIVGNTIVGFGTNSANTIGGIRITTPNDNTVANNITISGNTFRDCSIGVDVLRYPTNLFIGNNTFYDCPLGINSPTTGISKTNHNYSANIFFCETTGTAAIVASQLDEGGIISSNIITNYTAAITGTTSSRLAINGNTIDNCVSGIDMTNIGLIVASGNVMKDGTTFLKIETQGFSSNAVLTGNGLSTVTSLTGGAAIGAVTVASSNNVSV
jgi:hypothetical protein